MSRLFQNTLICLLSGMMVLVLAGCEQKGEAPAAEPDSAKPAKTAEHPQAAPAASGKAESETAPPPPPAVVPQPQGAAEREESDSPAEPAPPAPAEPSPPKAGASPASTDAGPASADDVEWVAEGAWRARLNASLDECGQQLEQLGAAEARHEEMLNKFRGDVEHVLPLHREMSDNMAKVKELAGTGRSVTVGEKTYGPAEMQDLATRTETALARVNEWSDVLHQRTGDAAVMRSRVRSGRDSLSKLRNEIITVDKNLSFLNMLEGAQLPQRESEDGQKSVQSFRAALLAEMGQKVEGLQQSADQLKSEIAAGAAPPLDTKPIETQPTLDALNALHMETLALLEKAN